MASDQPLPRGFVAWLPYLWSNVLFPGRPELATKVRPLSLAVLFFLPAILLYPTRDFLLLEPDEGRYAQIAREMQDRGEWVVPTLQGEPYLDKPPLLYWLTRLCFSVFGVSDETARLPSALAVHGTILIVYLLGRRSVGERSAFWGALLLTVAPGFMGMGRLLIMDGLLTLLTTATVFTAFEAVRGGRLKWGWWLVSSIACGLGILTKGPVILLLLFPPLVAHRWLTVRAGSVSDGQRDPSLTLPALKAAAIYLLVALLVNVPWYVAIYRHQPVFLRYFFWEHNVLRFIQPFDHLQPIWYYLPIVLGGLLPGTLLLWAFARYLISGDEAVAAGRSPALGFWLLAGGWCLLFFSLSGCKLPTYILPAFPCLTLALGDFIARTKWDRSTWTRAGLATATAVLLVAHYYAIPWYAKQRSPMADRELIARFCADEEVPVVCFPRNVDSVAFYLGRDDLRNVRTKATFTLIQDMLTRPRTVVLFTHRHSLNTLKEILPASLRIKEEVTLRRNTKGESISEKLAGDSPWGLCDVAVIERVQ